MPSHLDEARNLLLECLRAAHRNPQFLATTADLEKQNEEIAQAFLQWAGSSGFACEIVKVNGTEEPRYEVHWTHRGSTFVGFKQPAPERTPEDALLAGCAALLKNDWCRERLPS